jgi:cytochrome oxidase assembly protein ShyY1
MSVQAAPRGAFGLGLIALVLVAVTTSLGVWQLQRRVEKHALIATLSERLAQQPVPLPAAADWPTLTPRTDEFRRVRFSATYLQLPDAMVYSAGSAIRSDVSGPGAWAFLPARLPGGEIVAIDAGFVANTMQDRAQQNRAVAPLVTGQPVELTGYLRFPEAPGHFTATADRAKRLWFSRDVPEMARALGWSPSGERLAPFYIDLESPAPPSGVPKPGPLDVRLKDDHLGYAITWFGLALTAAGGFAAFLLQRRKQGAAA